ncbi:unnamed protein product [Sphagnum balticum]
MASKKKATPFQKAHELTYAIKEVSKDARGDVTVRCLFCVYEGHDIVEVDVAGRKCKQRNDIQYFTKPFTTYKYKSHHEGQHATSWITYQALSNEEKANYFNECIKKTNMLDHHFHHDKDTYEFFLSTEIVEVIIGDFFFCDDEQLEDIDDDDEQNPADAAHKKLVKKQNEKKNAMKLFCKKDDALVFIVTIKDCLHFDLAMDYVGIGLSFRQMAAAIEKAKDRTKTAKLIGLNDCIVGQYTRVLVAVALQQIALILNDESVWAMLLAGDKSTHRGQSFFDLHLRVCYRGDLVNLHLVALPMFERHSTMNIFNLIAKFMDALYNKWHSKLIGVSTDDENTMTSRHDGVVTHLVTCADNNVLRIWCTPHHINIVVKAAIEAIDNGVWVKQVYTFSVFLQAQDNLIIEMNVKCPKKTNRWAHFSCLLNFYISYRRPLLEYTQNKQPELMSSDLWWIITYAVAPAIDSINITLVQLQARSLLIAQWETLVQNLIGTIIAMFDIEVDSTDGEDALDDGTYVHQDSLHIPTMVIVNHIENQGLFSRDCNERLEEGDQQDMINTHRHVCDGAGCWSAVC